MKQGREQCGRRSRSVRQKQRRIQNWREYNRRLRIIHDTQNPSPDEDTKIRVKTAKDLRL